MVFNLNPKRIRRTTDDGYITEWIWYLFLETADYQNIQFSELSLQAAITSNTSKLINFYTQ